MGLLRNVLAGLLVGAGKGMENIAAQDEQKRREAQQAARDELMWQREQALMAMKKTDQLDVIVATGDQTIRTNAAGEGERRITNRDNAELQGGLAAESDDRRFKQAERMVGIEATAKKGLIEFEAKMKPAEREKVTRYVESADGTYVGLTDQGNEIPTNIAFVPHSQRSTSTPAQGGNSLSDYRPGGGAPAAGNDQPAKANPRLGSAMSRLQGAYTTATPQSHPSFFDGNGRKKPMSELVSQARSDLGAL